MHDLVTHYTKPSLLFSILHAVFPKDPFPIFARWCEQCCEFKARWHLQHLNVLCAFNGSSLQTVFLEPGNFHLNLLENLLFNFGFEIIALIILWHPKDSEKISQNLQNMLMV